MEVWITKPKLDKVTKVKATCPYCKPGEGGKLEVSFVEEIHGGFHYGPIFKDKNIATEDDFQITYIKDIIESGDKTIFIVEKK